MAVTMITSIKRYIGLSTDEKPTDAPAGSTFHAVDTGDEFVCYENAWILDLRKAAALVRSLSL